MFRFLLIHVRLVDEGGYPSLYKLVWAMCLCSIEVMMDFAMLLMADVYAMDVYMS